MLKEKKIPLGVNRFYDFLHAKSVLGPIMILGGEIGRKTVVLVTITAA